MVISNNHNVGNTTTPTQQQNATLVPIKQLTTTQMQACIAQGLCYNCDEEYIAGHRCKSKQFLHLQIDEPKHTYHNIEPISIVQDNDYRPTITNPNLRFSVERELARLSESCLAWARSGTLEL
ncbi:hypothetical protein Lal_00013505 [Lupinus albus]|nr:hypothetical protein Lal_00013505 [Lupinus albus]